MLNMFFFPCSGGDVWFHGEKGEGGIYLGTDEALYRCQGLHSHPDHQQENKHQILPRGGHRGERETLLIQCLLQLA